MSGICGIVNLDGTPIDRHLLQQMTAFMAFRGPDAQDSWADGAAGLGHAMLRTTFESEREQQPFSLDGKVWITADARIDGRDELKKEIGAGDRDRFGELTDVELILRAYHAWGEDCAKHLIGDLPFGTERASGCSARATILASSLSSTLAWGRAWYSAIRSIACAGIRPSPPR